MSKYTEVKSLRLDPWSASSLLQKAIRRGDVISATYAAQCFYTLRGKAIWRRLATIGFEDVGIANPDLVFEVTKLATIPGLRLTLGSDASLISDLCERLCASPKDRSADYLYSWAIGDEGQIEQLTLQGLNGAALVQVAASLDEPLVRRAAAALRCCTKAGQGLEVARSDLLAEFLAGNSDPVSSPLNDAVWDFAKKSAHAFVLMVPVLMSARAAADTEPRVCQEEVPKTEWVGNVPLYAFDKHTRVGKRAIHLLSKLNSDVCAVLESHVPTPSTLAIAEIAAFYTDAVPVSQRLEWAYSSELEAAGLSADMRAVGCPLRAVPIVLNAFKRNLESLNSYRRDVLLGGRPL